MRFRVLVVAVALLSAACGDDGGVAETDDAGSNEADEVILLDVVDGDLVGGSRQESIDIGESVEVIVSGNSDDTVHIHGYDLYVELEDGAGTTSFDALIPGTFEIELEAEGRLLVRMTVS